ncbi:MAG TPA: metal-dependent hydrolase [Gemmatimonadaceae bacterium]
MYTGHLGIALAAKGLRSRVGLWVLVAASQGCDWADAVAWAIGHQDPRSSRWLAFDGWTAQMASHSVPSVLVLAIVLAVLYWATARDGRGAALVAVVTLSHVPADYVTSVKPTWPGGPRIGLSLYAHPAADFLLEAAIVCGGWLLYRRSLPTPRAASRVAWLALVALVALQLAANAGRPGILGATPVDTPPSPTTHRPDRPMAALARRAARAASAAADTFP